MEVPRISRASPKTSQWSPTLHDECIDLDTIIGVSSHMAKHVCSTNSILCSDCSSGHAVGGSNAVTEQRRNVCPS